jgi:hypothetical protein
MTLTRRNLLIKSGLVAGASFLDAMPCLETSHKSKKDSPVGKTANDWDQIRKKFKLTKAMPK